MVTLDLGARSGLSRNMGRRWQETDVGFIQSWFKNRSARKKSKHQLLLLVLVSTPSEKSALLPEIRATCKD